MAYVHTDFSRAQNYTKKKIWEGVGIKCPFIINILPLHDQNILNINNGKNMKSKNYT
jgi:hypothetical protein